MMLLLGVVVAGVLALVPVASATKTAAIGLTGGPLTVRTMDGAIHYFPVRGYAGTGGPAPPVKLLTYHGGPVMLQHNAYAIFWLPTTM
jgi:hypothetical protein